MNMKKEFIEKNWFQLAILTLILLVLACLAYYFLYLIPKQAQNQQSQENLAQFSRQLQTAAAASAYQTCLSDAQLTFNENWSANCLDGSNTSSCSVSLANANSLKSQLASGQSLCEKHYSDTLDAIK